MAQAHSGRDNAPDAGGRGGPFRGVEFCRNAHGPILQQYGGLQRQVGRKPAHRVQEARRAGTGPLGEGFRNYGRFRKAALQAGEFELSASMSPRQVLEALAFGRPVLHRLHFAEGLTIREVALAVNATGLTTAEKFLAACNDRNFLQSKGINATNAEGYLFPETYFFPRSPGQDPYPILAALLERFRATVADLPQAADPEELHRLVILASLVEKETAVPSERGTVAGVYANRLRQGWLLQCDPTIIYGLGENFDGNLRRSHLKDASNPYNTYVHPGLPPAPFAHRERQRCGPPHTRKSTTCSISWPEKTAPITSAAPCANTTTQSSNTSAVDGLFPPRAPRRRTEPGGSRTIA